MAVSPEARFLRDLTHAFGSDSPASPTPATDLNWNRVVQLCMEHQVTASLLPLVESDDLPESFRTGIARVVDDSKRRTTLLLLEAERILPALIDAGCSPVVLKGIPLALTAYTRPQQRYFRDIDVLVERDQVETACDALRRLGFEKSFSNLAPRWYGNYHFHWVLQNRAGTTLEIHWALTLRESIYSFDLRRFLDESLPLTVGKITVRRPPDIDLLLHMVMQAVSVGFASLKHILDGALLASRIDDWPTLVSLARRRRLGNAVWFLLDMVEKLTGIAAPAEVMSALRPGFFARTLWRRLRQDELCLTHPTSSPYLSHEFLHWLCAPTLSLRVREIRRYLFPGEAGLLEAGYTDADWPGLRERTTLALSRLRSLGQMVRLVTKRMYENRSEHA